MKSKKLLNFKQRLLSSVVFSLLFAGSCFTNATAQTTVQIGTSTGVNVNFPITSYWGYSYSQQIYTAADMLAAGVTGPGTISKLRFYLNTSSSANSTAWTVYMGATQKTSFNSTTDWIPVTALTSTFSGTVTFPAGNNWMEIVFTTPFIWNGVDNIVVAVDENQPSYSSSNSEWSVFQTGVSRGINYRSDSTNPDPASPPIASGTSTSINIVQFEFTPATACSGIPSINSVVSTSGPSICEDIAFALSVSSPTFTSGITYKWQKLNGTTWENIPGATASTYANAGISATTDFQVVVGCSNTNDSIIGSINIAVNPAPIVLVDNPNVSICVGDAATFTASGAATYTWSPATALSATNTAIVNSTSTVKRVYTVIGTDANGCKNTATATITPNASVTADVVINPTDLCVAGSPVTASVGGSLPTNAGGVWNFRFLEADGVTEAQTWSTNDVFNFIPTQDSIYTFFYQLKNTACTQNIDSVSFQFVVGFGGTVTSVDYDCNNLGGTINVSDAFGQVELNELYSNDFSATADLTGVTFTGVAGIVDGRAVITPSSTSKNGGMKIAIPGFSPGLNNSMNVNFKLTADLPINTYGTGGADGLTYSFSNDGNPGANNNSTNGHGSKLRLCFDAADNSNENGNVTGIYLVYGWTANEAYGPASPQVIAFSNNTAVWKNKTDVPVKLLINTSGRATVIVDGVVVFDNVQLPAAYMLEDVSAWTHLFTARTGGDALRQAITDLNITAGTLSYGLSQGASTTVPTIWQTSTEFDGLAPGIYHVWLAKDSTATCTKNIETIEILNTNPVVNLGADTTICAGSTLTLDAQNAGAVYVWSNSPATTQTLAVTTAGSYAVHVTAPNGCTALGSVYVGVNNVPTATGITMQGNWQSYSFTVQNPMFGTTYDWNFGDGNTLMNASSSVSHVYWTEGTVTVSVKITNECGSVTITEQFVIANVVGVDAIELEGLSIYPNPVSSELTISLEDATESFVTISSVTGAIIVNETSFSSSTKINVESWQAGVYFVTVSNKGASTTQRIIVQ